MVFHVDLRYVLVPFMNLLFFLLQTNPEKPWNPTAIAALVLDSPYLVLNLILSLFALFLLLFFFYVSFQLPVTFGPLLPRAQDFSVALLLSVVAAFQFQPSLFWIFFLLVIITYPWHNQIFALFASFLRWLASTLRSIPIYFIIMITRNEENPNQVPPPVVELQNIATE